MANHDATETLRSLSRPLPDWMQGIRGDYRTVAQTYDVSKPGTFDTYTTFDYYVNGKVFRSLVSAAYYLTTIVGMDKKRILKYLRTLPIRP